MATCKKISNEINKCKQLWVGNETEQFKWLYKPIKNHETLTSSLSKP